MRCACIVELSQAFLAAQLQPFAYEAADTNFDKVTLTECSRGRLESGGTAAVDKSRLAQLCFGSLTSLLQAKRVLAGVLHVASALPMGAKASAVLSTADLLRR